MKNALWIFIIAISLRPAESLQAQTDSCGIRISLLTCSPGAELYSTFGHSALRVTDYKAGTDIVYNYGTFDFYDPKFLIKFTRGQLLYYLDQQNFSDFLNDYRFENRSVREQELSLDCNEKSAMQQALFVNLREENKRYLYDFLFDNCTTRLRDLVLTKSGQSYTTGNVLPSPQSTFRNHIHHYLDQNKQYWSKLGIDILLGSKMERIMTNDEAMFLPDYLEKGFDSSYSSEGNLVLKKNTLFEKSLVENEKSTSFFSPFIVFALLFLLVFAAGFLNVRGIASFLFITDFLIFLFNGLLGFLLVFMWFGTDHNTTQNNLNLLWAIPSHAIFAFLIRKNSSATRKYFRATAVLSLILVICWFLLPQELNTALIPWVMLTVWRSWKISKVDVKG